MSEMKFKLNNIRAIAIMVVVFGHSIILYSSSWNLYDTTHTSVVLDAVKKCIDLFQMPLFFSLSGYLFNYSKLDICGYRDFIKKKFYRLIVPFLFIAAFWMIPLKFIVGYPYYVGTSYFSAFINCLINVDSGHLWFLPTLFIMFIFWGALKHTGVFDFVISKVIILLMFLLIARFNYLLPSYNIPFLDFFYQYSWAFALGCCLPTLENNGGGKLYQKCIILAISIFICIFDTVVLNRRDVICGLFVVWSFYYIFPNKRVDFLERISLNSFGIYLFHSPLIYITFAYWSECSVCFVVFVNFVIFGFIAYKLTEYSRKSILRFIIGE